MLKKTSFILVIYLISLNSFSDDNEALMRMYERLEIIAEKMKQVTEENQQLNNKILNLQNQQNILYQDLLKKIDDIEKKLNEKNKVNSTNDSSNNNSTSKIDNKINIPKETNIKSVEKKVSDLDLQIKKTENIIPKDENDLEIAKKYVNDNFKSNLSTYQKKSEIDLYRSSFQLIKDKKYIQAENSFNAFLYLYPKSNYAANAQYWLSESIYAQNDYHNAMINFANVIEKYPTSSKIADAKLKIGYCYYSIKKWKEARFIFTSILKDYPNTSLSQLAKKKIESMNVEGR